MPVEPAFLCGLCMFFPFLDGLWQLVESVRVNGVCGFFHPVCVGEKHHMTSQNSKLHFSARLVIELS